MTIDRRMLGQLDVIRILRRYAIDHIVECDERAKGFYEAIYEAERYFQLDESTTPPEVQEMKEGKCAFIPYHRIVMKPDYWHIFPVGDAEEHNTESQGNCWCNPKMEEQENGNWVIVHNSLDGREKKERNEKPNSNSILERCRYSWQRTKI